MRRLPVLFFAAAIALWGLASIPDESGDENSLQVSGVRTAVANRHEQSAGTPRDAFTTPMARPSSLRAARLDRCGAPTETSDLVRQGSVCPSAGSLGDDL
jgi:hypothetical protein